MFPTEAGLLMSQRLHSFKMCLGFLLVVVSFFSGQTRIVACLISVFLEDWAEAVKGSIVPTVLSSRIQVEEGHFQSLFSLVPDSARS